MVTPIRRFQSAPRSLDRGDQRRINRRKECGVSIRAPVTRPGRPIFRAVWRRQCRFNPRPGHSTGATRSRFCKVLSKAFQSAPRSLDRGDTTAGWREPRGSCFNPRPGHSTGATKVSVKVAVLHKFQSAPRSLDRGDTVILSPSPALVLFQSAPRSLDRGDRIRCRVFAGRSSFNPRPGHSTGATDVNFFNPLAFAVSIRAPVTRPGRPGGHSILKMDGCFNPRPGHSTGATPRLRLHGNCFEVSIRAPVTRPGRRT